MKPRIPKHAVNELIPNARTRAAIREAMEEYRRGETVGFDNADDAIRYLNSLCDKN